MKNNIFYVYVYLDPRNYGTYQYGDYIFQYEPFYVGKAKYNNGYRHIRKCNLKKDNNKLKTNKIKKIQRETTKDPIILKYKEGLKEYDAILLEINMIKYIGRKDLNTGPLVNLTAGGEGNPKLSEKSKKQKGQKIKKWWKNEKYRNNIIEKNKEAHKGKKLSENHKRKIVESSKYLWQQKNFRNKTIKAIRLSSFKQSKSLKEYYKNNKHPFDGRKHKEITKKKISNTLHQKELIGKKNGNNIWIYYFKNIITNKKFKTYSLRKFCDENNLNFNTISRYITFKNKYNNWEFRRKIYRKLIRRKNDHKK